MKKTFVFVFLILFFSWLSGFLYLQLESHQFYSTSVEQKAEARAYLQGKIAPVPSNWVWRDFSPEPEINLRTGTLDVENAKGTIVVVPGWTGFAELSMHTMITLNKAGYRVAHIEYRGQGKSTRLLSHPEKGHVKSYAARARSLAAYAETVRIKDKPLFFFSESMGAHISMRMAAELQPDVRAYALLVPMIKMNLGAVPYGVGKLMADTASAVGLSALYAPGQSQWPDLPLVFGKAHDCNSNPQTAQRQSALFALDETLRTKGATMGMISQTMASTDLILSEGYMDDLVQPVMIFTAGIDTLVITEESHQFCDSLKNCQLTHYADARHCIHGEDPQRMDRIVEQTISFFDAQLTE